MHRPILIIFVLSALTFACGGKDEPGGSGSSAPAKAKDGPVPSPFAEYGLDDLAKKLQGSWLLYEGRAAWEISGDEVVVFDGKAEKTYELVVESPCKIGLLTRNERGWGADMKNLNFDGDRPYLGMQTSGARVGEAYFICAGLETLVFERDSCTLWKREIVRKDNKSVQEWQSKPADCGPGQHSGREALLWKTGVSDRWLWLDGDRPLSGGNPGGEKVDSFATAKAKVSSNTP